MESDQDSCWVPKPWPSTSGLQRPTTRPAGNPLPALSSLHHTSNLLGTVHCCLLQAVFPDFCSLSFYILTCYLFSLTVPFLSPSRTDISGLVWPALIFPEKEMRNYLVRPAAPSSLRNSVGQWHSQLVTSTTGIRILVFHIPKQHGTPEGLRLPLCSVRIPSGTGTLPQNLVRLSCLGLNLDLSTSTVQAPRASPHVHWVDDCQSESCL